MFPNVGRLNSPCDSPERADGTMAIAEGVRVDRRCTGRASPTMLRVMAGRGRAVGVTASAAVLATSMGSAGTGHRVPDADPAPAAAPDESAAASRTAFQHTPPA